MSGYYVAFDYRLFVEPGTTASAAPTSESGMTEVLSLTNASINGTTDTTDAPLDYSSEFGWKNPLATNIGWSIPAGMNLALGSEGYRVLKNAWITGAAGTALQIYRISPVKDGTVNADPEIHAGVAQVVNFQEDIQAGNVATVSFDFQGYGPLLWYPQGLGIATLTVTTGGSGMTPATYEDVPLVGLTPIQGAGSGRAATADIVVAGGGAVTAAPTIQLAGTNYNVGDVLTVASANMGGAGVMPTFTVATVS
jgi:hypothetical protein